MATLFWQRRPTFAAVQWTGTNVDEVVALVGEQFTPLPDDDDPTVTARVYDTLHGAWLPVHTGDWILQGSWGEFTPYSAAAFAAGYEPAATT